MSEQNINQQPIILHVGSAKGLTQTHGFAGRIDTLLGTLRVNIHSCSDVYLGLARICSDRFPDPKAVLVCVDDLVASELEFFSILARLRRDLPVYVYGHDRSKSRMARAMEFGATAEATESLLRALAASPAPKPEPAPEPEPEPEPVVLDEPGKHDETVTHDETVALEGEARCDRLPEATEAAPVRVPWLRYAAAPGRKAPPRDTGPVQPVDHDEPGDTTSGFCQPLLTEEELQALLGDNPVPPGDDPSAGQETAL